MVGAACVDAEAAGCLLISMSRTLRHHRAKIGIIEQRYNRDC